jgi:hypothetical protein
LIETGIGTLKVPDYAKERGNFVAQRSNFIRWIAGNCGDMVTLRKLSHADVNAIHSVGIVMNFVESILDEHGHASELSWYYHAIAKIACEPMKKDGLAGHPEVRGQDGLVLILRDLVGDAIVFGKDVPEATQDLWRPLVKKTNEKFADAIRRFGRGRIDHQVIILEHFLFVAMSSIDQGLVLYYPIQQLYSVQLKFKVKTSEGLVKYANTLAIGLQFGLRYRLHYNSRYDNMVVLNPRRTLIVSTIPALLTDIV